MTAKKGNTPKHAEVERIITINSFRSAVRTYRENTQDEVSEYALKTSYLELSKGRKTILVKKMEQFFSKPIENVIARSIPKDKPFDPNKSNGTDGINYQDPKLLEQILDPKYNGATKGLTYQIAVNKGKLFAILDCAEHGEALHRCYPCRKKGEAVATTSAGYCQMCKIHVNNRRKDLAERKYKDMRDLKDKFLAQLKSNQAAT